VALVLFFDNLQDPSVADEVVSSNCHGRAAVINRGLTFDLAPISAALALIAVATERI
jgi:hypothetical protein